MNQVGKSRRNFFRFFLGFLFRIPVGYRYKKRGRPKPNPFRIYKTTKTFLLFHPLEIREVGDDLPDFRRRVAVVLEYGLDGLRAGPVDLWHPLIK